MKAIIGLGNPESEYNGTRHNAGFEVVDRVRRLAGPGELKKNNRFIALTDQANFFDVQVLFAKPLTYMNDSGKAVLAIKQFYKLGLKDLLIIHDDVSIPLGRIRLQKSGGAGGQHGVESIIECLGGEKDFNRLKIGIGPDPGGSIRHHYVLQKFSPTERIVLDKVIEMATDAVCCWSKDGIDKAMNEFNGLDLG